MQRDIFEVSARIVDANGTYAVPEGYPKLFDAKSYGNDSSKALRRAESAFHEVLTSMYKIDTRQLQTASILLVNTNEVIQKEVIGRVADIPEN